MSTPHVELRGVSKRYGGVRALTDVGFAIERGTVHAFVGENGAGKSTLSKVIAGAEAPSDGELWVDGRRVRYRSPRQAMDDGIVMMEQELAMLRDRSVLDNVFLGNEAPTAGVVTTRRLRRRFDALRERTGFDLDPRARVGGLRVADQQKVEILRALARNAKFIIMDEPTAPLTMTESDQLHEVVRQLRAAGTTVVYISHFLEEVLAIADTVTIMRDGRHVRTTAASTQTEATLVRGMLGRDLDVTFPGPPPPPPVSAAPVLSVRGLTSAGRFRDIHLDVRPGEIVGIAGLIGSGRSEVAKAIFGMDRYQEGTVLLGGRRLRAGSPAASISRGLLMLPESRREDGLVMMRTVADNITLPRLKSMSGFGFVERRRLRREARAALDKLGLDVGSLTAPVVTLSGGNQQKVVLAKCVAGDPAVLIVDEPTRGVDVGAKRAIYEVLMELAARGLAIVVISSDLEEVLGLAHRVVVMRRGRFVADVAASQTSAEAVLSIIFGTTPAVPDRASHDEEISI